MTQSQQSSSVLTFGFEKFDPYAMMMFLRRRLGVILGVAAIVFVVASGAFFLIRPQYKASSVILIELSSAGGIDREAAAAGLAIDSGFVDSQIEVVKSQALVGRVVKKLNLDKDSEFNRQKGGILSFVSFLSHKLHGEAEADVTSPIVAKFIEFLSIERRGLGYAISVEFTWPDPKKAAEYANALADTYLDDQSETRFEQMKRAATWLNNRLAVVAVNVRDAEQVVEQFKAQHNLQDVSGVTVNDQQLSEINALLVNARADVAERAAKYKHVQELLANSGSPASIGEVLQSPVINNLKMQLADVMRRAAHLNTRYGSNRPVAGSALADVLAERRELDAQIDREVNQVVTNVKNELDVAISRETSLEESLRKISESQNIGKEASVQLHELERQAESSRVIYQSMLSQMKIAQEKSNVEEPKARIISRATAPIEPSFPKMAILIPFFAALGLVLGVGSGYIIEKIDDAFYSAEDIETTLRVPVLSVLPKIGSARNAQRQNRVLPRLLKEEPLGAYSESIRTLHNAMEMSLGGQFKRVIMVTSSVPSEGKSNVALSLATSIASAGKSVVVVDLDLRKPSVDKRLVGTCGKPGILEFIAANSQDLQNYITYMQDLNVFLMAANRAIKSPPTVLTSSKLAQTIDALVARFDYVVLDTPPLGLVIDSRLIANISAGLILVIEWGQTPREVVSRSLSFLAGTKADVLGVVLNAVDFKRQRHYSRYGHGYYHSRYSDYYGYGQGSSGSGKRQEDAALENGDESVVAVPRPRRSASGKAS